MPLRWVTACIALVLLLGAVSALSLHWLFGLFWLEVAVVIAVVDRTVGTRAFLLADTRREHPGHAWPPSRSWLAQIAAATALGLAIAYLGVKTQPLAVLIALMVLLAGYMLWAIPTVKRRQEEVQNAR
jgi:hypothetical protein